MSKDNILLPTIAELTSGKLILAFLKQNLFKGVSMLEKYERQRVETL
jgi:hypothetical protein